MSRSNTFHYFLDLPTSVVITGIDKPEILNQAFEAVKTFRIMDEDQVAALLAKTERAAAAADSRVKLKLDENIPASLKAQSLLQDAQGKFQEAVLDIYEKHIGIERTAGVSGAWNPKPIQPMHAQRHPFQRSLRDLGHGLLLQ
ncbi:MAG: hypothetical protein JOZ31_07180 [Verrucomicrobia bacterium]|nr:hypothetical protein [Verrucomicrobiota bacterium]